MIKHRYEINCTPGCGEGPGKLLSAPSATCKPELTSHPGNNEIIENYNMIHNMKGQQHILYYLEISGYYQRR